MLSDAFHRLALTPLRLRVYLWLAFLAALSVSGLALAAPSVTLTAAPTSGVSPLAVTLTWSSTEVGNCIATGGWSGSKTTSGSATVTATASTTYSLTCTATSGTATVTWTPPTTRTDGSPLSNLAKYRLYATQDGQAVAGATPIEFNAPASSYVLSGLAAGTWYAGLKAVDANGLASIMSNVASKTVVLAQVSASASVTVTPAPPNPPTLVTVAQTAYEVTPHPSGYRLGRAIGTVPLGTSCSPPSLVQSFGWTYYQVPNAAVTITKPPKTSLLGAACELG